PRARGGAVPPGRPGRRAPEGPGRRGARAPRGPRHGALRRIPRRATGSAAQRGRDLAPTVCSVQNARRAIPDYPRMAIRTTASRPSVSPILRHWATTLAASWPALRAIQYSGAERAEATTWAPTA